MDSLLEFLEKYLTENRKYTIERVLHERTKHFTVVVENVYHSQNTSAILRSCECFGIQDLHVIEKGFKYRPNVQIVKGATKWIDIHKYPDAPGNTTECLTQLKNKGYKIIAASPHQNDVALETLDPSIKSAFVFGGEKAGISQEVKAQADVFMKIPIMGFTESFNVSVAVAITLHHMVTRLRETSVCWQLSKDEIQEKKLDWTKKSLKKSKALIRYWESLHNS
jgi:tRNA (guanosine-2'-O-)-methyltransferase